jgi:hypothetical protein
MSSKLPVSVTLMAFVAILSHNLFAASATVGTCAGPGTHYLTIQAAVTATAAPAVIGVCPGTYPEQVEIAKNVTLKGIVSGNQDAAVIVPPSGGVATNGTDVYGDNIAAQIWVHDATAVTLSNLVVDGTGNNFAGCTATVFEGIAFENSSGKITDDIVRNQYQTDFTDYGGCQNGLAINVESLTNSNTVIVSSNTVRFYQKNGITASGAWTGPGATGPAVTISNNFITGLAVTSMNWPGGAGENGIQFGGGATGSIMSNVVNDNLWYGEYPQFNYAGLGGTTTGNGASGILVYSSTDINITSNEVGSAQYGIAIDSDPTTGPADGAYLESNKVSGTQVFDAVDLCSSSNTMKSNNIYGSAQSGIHVDDACTGSSNSNNIIHNVINEACAGILEGTGTGNTYTPNSFYGVSYTTLGGDTCTPPISGPVRASVAKPAAAHASPFHPRK